MTCTTVRKRATYPWPLWTDGQPRIARRGVDFWCTAANFTTVCYTRARSRGMKVHTRILPDSSVYFRFYPCR